MWLLSETGLTYTKVIEIAKTIESAYKDSRALIRADPLIQKIVAGLKRMTTNTYSPAIDVDEQPYCQ